MNTSHSIQRIVSGGQTGVDRAALDAAISAGLEHGGWCPRGRRAEDGRIPERYRLSESEGADYAERTRRNILDSDATLILLIGPLDGGTLLTWREYQRVGKPCRVVRLHHPGPDEAVRRWLAQHGVATLNVAGPRSSKQPAVYDAALSYLNRLLSGVFPAAGPISD